MAIYKNNFFQTFYLYIGGKGSWQWDVRKQNNQSKGGWNGGGYGTGDIGGAAGGGGATNIRLINGNWNDQNSLESRILVAGGGGGSYRGTSISSDGGNGGGESGAITEKINDSSGQYDGLSFFQNFVEGSLGKGGTSTSKYFCGGGGGYMGGISGNRHSGGGSGYLGDIFIDGNTTISDHTGNGKAIITYIRSLFNTCKQKPFNSYFIITLIYCILIK